MENIDTTTKIKIPKKKTLKKRSPLKEEIIIEPGPPLHIPLPIESTVVKKKYCPRGTRKNIKTGICEPIKNVKKSPEPVISEPIIPESVIIKKTTKKKGIKIIISPVINPEEPISIKKNKSKEANEEEPFEETPIENKAVELAPSLSIENNELDDFKLEDKIGNIPYESNKFLQSKEKVEYDFYDKLKDSPDEFPFLYPDLNDPNFNIKIAKRKEFFDTQYDGTVYDIKKQSEVMCNAEFELMPYQLFVKNFLSFQTPYNSLLLYHGLGTGKTCSSIGIAEEMRMYLKQMGIKQRIIIVASPNVQDNYKLQLFNEKKLKLEGDIWNIQSCIGNSLLKEVNPTNLKGISKEKIISNIKKIINDYYVFMGYVEFANEVTKKTEISLKSGISEKERKSIVRKNIKQYFNNRLIIIDEVHNIRLTDENKNKRTATKLFELAKYADNLRILLLSATPMYNSYKEIIWITNLMNLNDKRSEISIQDVFDKEGKYIEKTEKDGILVKEGGRELLQRKLTGYISYVRGENPYSFPYRVYPEHFSPENTFSHLLKSNNQEEIQTKYKYPTIQLNKKPIDETTKLKYIQVYLSKIGNYQENGYSIIIKNMIQKIQQNKEDSVIVEHYESFGYEQIQNPLQALNIVYPSPRLDNIIEGKNHLNYQDEPEIKSFISSMIGIKGLTNVMNHIDDSDKKQPERFDFEYKPEILKRYGRIFHQEHIHKYSNKISKICDIIRKSKGIIMIYSQYIDGGLVPIALALEEMGISRYASSTKTYTPKKNLFKKSQIADIEPIDSLTMKPKKDITAGKFKQAKYVMITGDKSFSINNDEDVKYITDENNKNGELVKVVLISKAGAEGLDFKNIRQVHILDPWYNMNRIEQIIGRAVRNLSHCRLPFEERNVELYLHSTILEKTPQDETVDLYVYRLAEKKAIQIGRVSRLIKETSVDCILNIKQTNFTIDKLNALVENQNIKINLSSGLEIEYKIGDTHFSNTCDYMENCEYVCSPTVIINQDTDIIKDTYNNEIIKMNNDRIIEKIRQLFREQYVYKRQQLINSINLVKQYPLEQIYYALTYFIQNKNEFLVDKYGRLGNLVNHGEYYTFQPIEITDDNASIFERSTPIDYKHNKLLLEIPKEILKDENIMETTNIKETNLGVIETDLSNVQESFESLVSEIGTNLGIATTFYEFTEPQNKWTWFMHASRINDLLQNVYNITNDNIKKHLIYHMLDSLLLPQKFVLIKRIYSGSWESSNSIEETIKIYFDERIMKTPRTPSKKGIFLTKNNKYIIYIQSKENPEIWTESEAEDLSEQNFGLEIKKFIVPVKNMFRLIGYFSLFKNKEMVFKIKDMTKDRDIGARVGSGTPGKAKLIQLLNIIQNKTVYNQENTNMISQLGLCVILEIIMRDFTIINNQNPALFLSSEKAFLNLSSKIN